MFKIIPLKATFAALLFVPTFTFAVNNACHQMKSVTPYKGPKVSKFGVYHGYSKAIYNSWIRKSRYLAMPDGTKLAMDIIIPAKDCVMTTKPLPVVLTQTPYQRVYQQAKGKVYTEVQDQGLQNLIRHGYVFVSVAIRGTAASFGRYRGMFSPIERKDIYHVIEWLAKQPFSDGKVGMIGGSYQGITQYMAASQNPPSLKALYAEVATFNFYNSVYTGGIFHKPMLTYWTQMTHDINMLNRLVPVDNDPLGVQLMQARLQHEKNATAYKQLEKVPYYNSSTRGFSWQKNNPAALLKSINKAKIPVYISDGWYDIFAPDALFWYTNYAGPKKMIIGAWPHNTNGAPAKLENVRQQITATEALRWFDYWLKGIKNGVMNGPSLHYDVLKQDYLPNKWHTTNQWPPKSVVAKTLYLNSDNQLSKQSPKKNSLPSNYTVDYTTSTGHQSRWGNVADQGFINYNDLAYNDTKSLTFTTKPLIKPLTIVGFPVVTLYLSASTNDVDIHAVLEAVDKQGFSHYLTEGMLRASQRKLVKAPWKNYNLPYQSHEKSDVQKLKSGEVVALKFYLFPFARTIPAGDKLRIAIMGADMNNTATLVFPQAPKIKIYHNNQYPSQLMLPVTHVK